MTSQKHSSDDDFKQELIATAPLLRSFGLSLSGSPDIADELVQETMLKAWAARSRFSAGTSMRAWTFVILRNTYFSQVRRNRFSAPYDEALAEQILSRPALQEDPLHLLDVEHALLELSENLREALILVGVGGYSYDEASGIVGCATGTMKSRVSRARTALAEILEAGQLRPGRAEHRLRANSALDRIMEAAELYVA